ncbi:MAG TPA: hypothetical protein VLQ65_00605 [Saliniramus sp.]|nr:hypothetical protein [Saliniramus sp.]
MKKLLPALSLLLLSTLAAFTPASVSAQSEADCEKHVEALAYNACLAALGPRVGESRRSSVASPDASQSRPTNPVQRRPDGRKAATFDVITGKK